MRKEIKYKYLPKEDDYRTITKFLWFPEIAKVGPQFPVPRKSEKRWLETATINQIYYSGKWHNLEFIDE